MKTIYRFLTLGILMTVFSAITVTTSFAQDPQAEKTALYNKYLENYDKKEIEKTKIALEAGKQYVEKYGPNPEDKEQVDYIKADIPRLEKVIAAYEAAQKTKALYERFNNANKTKNTSELFTNGKEILSQKPDFLDVSIVLASAGFDQAAATTPVDTYNADTVSYAKAVIQQIEAGKTSTTGDWGVLNYVYKNKDYSDSKSNTLGWMNYSIGYIMYYRQGKDNADLKKAALPYLYKATQYNSFHQKNPFLYQTIGAWYLDQAIKIDADRRVKITAAGDKDTDETLSMLADQKGYADRAIDAYARAYRFAKADTTSKKEYVDGLYGKVKQLYEFRYDGKTDGMDLFLTTVASKPLPDPVTPIVPVKEEVPAATTTTSMTTSPTTPATTMVKPATTTTVKPSTTTTTPKPTTPTTPTMPKPTTPTKPATTPTKPMSSTTPTNGKTTTPGKKGTR